MDNGEYIDLLAASALRKDNPSIDALDELIAIVELAVKELEK